MNKKAITKLYKKFVIVRNKLRIREKTIYLMSIVNNDDQNLNKTL